MSNSNFLLGHRLVNMSDLSYIVLPEKIGSLINSDLYFKIYSFWKTQWEPVLRSVKKIEFLKSDDFLRQFEVNALLYQDNVIGILCLDYFDLNSLAHLEHSYFSWLSYLDYNKFRDCGLSLVINQLAVDPFWRGENGVADLLVGLACKRYSESVFSSMICATRNTRSTNKLAERWSAHILLDDQVVNEEPSTFYRFNKDCYLKTQNSVKIVAERLWHSSNFINLNNFYNLNTINKGESYEIQNNG